MQTTAGEQGESCLPIMLTLLLLGKEDFQSPHNWSNFLPLSNITTCPVLDRVYTCKKIYISFLQWENKVPPENRRPLQTTGSLTGFGFYQSWCNLQPYAGDPWDEKISSPSSLPTKPPCFLPGFIPGTVSTAQKVKGLAEDSSRPINLDSSLSRRLGCPSPGWSATITCVPHPPADSSNHKQTCKTACCPNPFQTCPYLICPASLEDLCTTFLNLSDAIYRAWLFQSHWTQASWNNNKKGVQECNMAALKVSRLGLNSGFEL